MPLYLTRSAYLQTCTDHDDCKGCRELADACHASRTGRPAGAVEVEERYSFSKMHEGETVIAIARNERGSYLALTENYIGRVVETEETSEKIMSDVWDTGFWSWCAKKDGEFVRVYMGCSWDRECDRGSYGFESKAIVDASPELVAAWQAWMAEQLRKAREKAKRDDEHRRYVQAQQEAREPTQGRPLRVVKGRKVPVGTVGTCIWFGSTKYGERVGIKVNGQEDPVWTAASNVEVMT